VNHSCLSADCQNTSETHRHPVPPPNHWLTADGRRGYIAVPLDFRTLNLLPRHMIKLLSLPTTTSYHYRAAFGRCVLWHSNDCSYSGLIVILLTSRYAWPKLTSEVTSTQHGVLLLGRIWHPTVQKFTGLWPCISREATPIGWSLILGNLPCEATCCCLRTPRHELFV
jgi:hypothetical protein